MMGSGKQSPNSKKNSHFAAFMAPEIQTGVLNLSVIESAHHPSADIFSYGAIILHTISQQWPEPLADDALKQSVETQSYIERHQSQINLVGAKSKLLNSLLLACLDHDPNRRPRIIQVSEIIRTLSEKFPFRNKCPITWQAEVEQAVKQVCT